MKFEVIKESLKGFDEIKEFNKLAKEIGLKTLKDVERFKKEYPEDTLQALRDYRKSLGDDFEVDEDPEHINQRFRAEQDKLKQQNLAKVENYLDESLGFLRKYKNCSIHDMGDQFVVTNSNGKTIGSSRTEIGAEAIIDEYVSKNESLIESINDGWELEDADCDILDTLDDCNRLAYEVKNCVRGAYSKCYTYEELGNYIIELANRLTSCGEYILNTHESDEDLDEKLKTVKDPEEKKKIQKEISDLRDAAEKADDRNNSYKASELNTYADRLEENSNEDTLLKSLKEDADDINKYILEIGYANNNGTWDKTKKILKGTRDKVEARFNSELEKLIQETANNNNLSKEEIDEYIEELEEYTPYEAYNHVCYSEDPDGEWMILVDQIFEDEEDLTSIDEALNLTEDIEEGTLRQEIKQAVRKMFSGLDDEDYNGIVGDYLYIDIAPINDWQTKVEVRAELSYSQMDRLANRLDPIIQKYDDGAYFDHEDAGIIVAYIKTDAYRKWHQKEDTELSDENTSEDISHLIFDKQYGDKKVKESYDEQDIDDVKMFVWAACDEAYQVGKLDEDLIYTIFEDLEDSGLDYDKDAVREYFYTLLEEKPFSIEENLTEASNKIDEYKISDTEALTLDWEKSDNNGVYVIKKIYLPSNESDIWSTEFYKTYPTEEAAKKAFNRYKSKYSNRA